MNSGVPLVQASNFTHCIDPKKEKKKNIFFKKLRNA